MTDGGTERGDPKAGGYRETMTRPYLAGLPEMDLFPTPEARRQALQELDASMTPRSVVGWIKLFAIAAPLILLPYYATVWLVKWLAPAWLIYSGRIALAVSLVVYIVLISLLIRMDLPRTIRKKLLHAGVPVCLKCGYDLRSISSDHCPECGRSISGRARELMKNDVSSS